MENFRIYRDGQYDYKANLQFKINQTITKQIHKIDTFFEKY